MPSRSHDSVGSWIVYGPGSPCCGTVFGSLFAEAIEAPPKRRLTLSEGQEDDKYRDLVDELIEMPSIRDTLDLDSIPASSTLCEAFDRLEMGVRLVLSNVSLPDVSSNGGAGIDATGFERARPSAHYTKRTNLTIQQLKTALLVNMATNAVLDIHVTTARKQGTQIPPRVEKRNGESIPVLTGDEGL